MKSKRKAYLYIKGNNIKEVISFLGVYEEFYIKKINENYLLITYDLSIDSSIFENVRNLAIAELYQDFTVFIVPLIFEVKIESILNMIPSINSGIYDMTNIIPEIVLLGEIKLIHKLRNYYLTKFNQENIDTILGFITRDLNATKTAKALYMHRNTLNYRLDNFINKTEIDIRSFKGALAIYLLFKT